MLDATAISRRRFVASLALLPLAGAAMKDPALERLIDLNTRALGGAKRLRRLRTMDAVLRLQEPGLDAIGRYVADRAGIMRIDVFVDGKRGYSEGIDRDGVWAWPGDQPQPKPSSEKGRQALLHGIAFNLVPLFALRAAGHRLELVSGDPPCIQLTFADGFETRMFLDPLTGHVVRRQDRRAYHPDVDSTEKRIESRFSAFRVVDGVASAWLSEDYDLTSGARIGRTQIVRLVRDGDVSRRIPRTAPVTLPQTG